MSQAPARATNSSASPASRIWASHGAWPLLAAVLALWLKQLYAAPYLLQATWEPASAWHHGGLRLLAATLGASLLVLSLWYVLPLRPRGWMLLLVNGGFSLLIFGQLLHHRHYHTLASLHDTPSFRMLPYGLPYAGPLLRWADILLFFDLLVFAVLAATYQRRRSATPGAIGWKARSKQALAGLLAGLLLCAPVLGVSRVGDSTVLGYQSSEVAAAVGVLPYHLIDFAHYLGLVGPGSSDDDISRIVEYFRERRPSPPRSKLYGSAAGKNVILVQLESFNAFPLGLVVGGRPVTPHLDRFAAYSLRFTSFYDQTWLGTTSDAEFSALQSLHPLPAGRVAMNHQGNRLRALPAVLREHGGYFTYSACGAPGRFWSMERLHPQYGFQRSDFQESFPGTDEIGGWVADRDFFAAVAPRLAQLSPPFFAYLITSSNHDPYVVPATASRLPVGHLEGTRLGNYLQSVHHADAAFGLLLDRLQKHGLLESSLVAVYGDHRGFLRERAALLSLLDMDARWNDLVELEVENRLPLLIRLPQGASAGEYDAPGGHLDIAPTILALLGIEDRQSVMLGRDLTAGPRGMVVFRNGSFATQQHLYKQVFGRRTGARCWDRHTGEPIDCHQLEAARSAAWEQLGISDRVIRGDLLPRVGAALSSD